jgi:hypothetical protein
LTYSHGCAYSFSEKGLDVFPTSALFSCSGSPKAAAACVIEHWRCRCDSFPSHRAGSSEMIISSTCIYPLALSNQEFVDHRGLYSIAPQLQLSPLMFLCGASTCSAWSLELFTYYFVCERSFDVPETVLEPGA